MTGFVQIQQEIEARTSRTVAARPDWPCRKGCADCCRSLASEPRVTREEWERIARVIDESARQRIRETDGRVCRLLDTDSGECTVYAARPLACRAYGFYAERERVLGCGRIEALAAQSQEIVWGNHAALESRMSELGPARTFSEWLAGGS